MRSRIQVIQGDLGPPDSLKEGLHSLVAFVGSFSRLPAILRPGKDNTDLNHVYIYINTHTYIYIYILYLYVCRLYICIYIYAD